MARNYNDWDDHEVELPAYETTIRGDEPVDLDGGHDIVIENSESGMTRKIKLDLEVDASAKNLGPNPFARWIHLAAAFDAWRPFPRLFIIMYMYMVYRTIEWYIALDAPTLEQSGLISVVVGAGAAWFGLYVGSGRRGGRSE